MTKDFEARAKEKSEEWLSAHAGEDADLSRKCGYEHRAALKGFLAGARYGREAGLDLAAGIADTHAKNFDAGTGKWASCDIADQIRAAKGESTPRGGDVTPKEGG